MSGACWLLLPMFFLAGATSQESTRENKNTEVLKEKEKGRGHWDTEDLEMCLQSPTSSSPVPGKLSCYRRRLHVEFIDFELYAERPVLMRIRNFVGKSTLDGIINEVQSTDDGRWMEKEDTVVAPIFKRLQRVVRLNPEIAEDFRIAVYGGLESNGPHYDYLSATERRQYGETDSHYGEERLELLGNRLATMLLAVKPAAKGGATAFPKLRTVIRPDPGDLLLWFNADSNGDREDGSLHAGCPIEAGEKIAVVAFFRANFQDGLKCSTSHTGYEPFGLLKSDGRLEDQYIN